MLAAERLERLAQGRPDRMRGTELERNHHLHAQHAAEPEILVRAPARHPVKRSVGRRREHAAAELRHLPAMREPAILIDAGGAHPDQRQRLGKSFLFELEGEEAGHFVRLRRRNISISP